jgi:hypothetical protein
MKRYAVELTFWSMTVYVSAKTESQAKKKAYAKAKKKGARIVKSETNIYS